MFNGVTGEFIQTDEKVIWRSGTQILWVEPWGKDSIRVRATEQIEMPQNDWTLLKQSPVEFEIKKGEDEQRILENGIIKATISQEGRVSFFDNKTNRKLCSEERVHWTEVYPRSFKAKSNKLFYTDLRMESFNDEKIYGLGQHKHGRLDQKGCVIDLEQTNTEISIPFMLSSRGYGGNVNISAVPKLPNYFYAAFSNSAFLR